MVRLLVFVEGGGERLFVQEILRPHLQGFGIQADAAYAGHARGNPSGGVRSWAGNAGVRTDILHTLKQSGRSYKLFVTTMVDYYGLPLDWPHRETASLLLTSKRSFKVESGMREDVQAALGDDWRINRFIPYVSLHEFESLILADPDVLLHVFPNCEPQIDAIKKDVENLKPEDVDDGPNTAPSKRIISFLPNYANAKSRAAVNALRHIELNHLRTACPHFGQWVDVLEMLPSRE